MTKTLYTRPAKTKATALGERNRARWTRHLRKRLFALVSTSEVMAAEEGSMLEAIRRQMRGPRNRPWEDRPRWATLKIRIDQMAVIEMLQSRHLKVTGKEISKAEVLAALMADGLERILGHADFGGSTADDTDN
jgi:hypothetical protein